MPLSARATVSWFALLAVAACGPPPEPTPPPATFQTFSLQLESPDAGTELAPLDQVKLHVVYRGDLARSLKVNVTITDPSTNESSTRSFLAGPTQDDTAFDVHTGWQATDELFKRPGRFVVSMTASITATIRGSEPWTTSPVSLTVVASPALQGIAITPPPGTTPLPYGAGVSVTVTGTGLWDDVTLGVVDLDRGRAISALDRSLAFDLATTSRSTTVGVTDSSLETVGVHRVQLVATFGSQEVRSEPFALEITHLVSSVVATYRDANDVSHPTDQELRFDAVKDLVIHVSGVNLAGHTVVIDGESVAATGDELEVTRVPRLDAFAAGQGVHEFRYSASAGGVERSDTVALRRWKLESCGWFKEDGTPASGTVPLGTKVVLRASGWGFPDTSGILIFKKDQAEFLLWERDDGQDTSTLPQPLINNDDEVDWFKVDVLGSVADQPWTTVFTEETEFLLFNTHAEYYFEVTLQDETCTSAQLDVPSK